VASIQIYFQAAKFLSHREGGEGAESAGGVLGERAAPAVGSRKI